MMNENQIPQTENSNPASHDLDRMSTLEMVQTINREDAHVAAVVEQALPEIAAAIDAITSRMRKGGRLVYLGAGTSGRLGVLDASECPPTFRVPAGLVVGVIAGGDTALRSAVEKAEDSPEQGKSDLAHLSLSSQDSVVGITASGGTPYVLGGLRYAREIGALTIGIACNRPAAISSAAKISILVPVGAEVISGSTRLKSGTAQKMVLNMLSTGVMVKLGKTYGNLMVDLQASNTKLRKRAVRLVKQVCEMEDETAQTLLEACNWEVKTAIAAFHLKSSPSAARSALQAANGMLREVIGPGR